MSRYYSVEANEGRVAMVRVKKRWGDNQWLKKLENKEHTRICPSNLAKVN